MKNCTTSQSLGATAPEETAASHRPIDLNRRQFMRLAVLGSTALLVPCDLLESLEPATDGHSAPWRRAPSAQTAGWRAGSASRLTGSAITCPILRGPSPLLIGRGWR
jgi:hypothetical protein